MTISICPLASGSSGNSYLVRSNTSALLVDVGISCKRILTSLSELIACDEIEGILITHEHSDHVKGLKVLTKKKPEWKVYINEGTDAVYRDMISSNNICTISHEGTFNIGDINIRAFPVSHDAFAPLGFCFLCQGKSVCIVTDTGYITEAMQDAITESDIIVIEANHDENMLKMGKYPWMLKKRILGYEGHLSNEAAAGALVKALQGNAKYRQVILAHLSAENNFPQLAYQTVKNILEENGYYVGKHISLSIAKRDEIGDMLEV